MARLALTVEPGTNFVTGASITADDLNNAASPSVYIDEESIQPEHIDTDALVAKVGDSLRAENYVPWGTFAEDLFLAASTACPATLRTAVHPGWWVLPTGAEVPAVPSGRTSATTTDEAGRSALRVTGHASLTQLDVGTYIPPGIAQILYGENMTFSIYIYNRSGTSFTPVLDIYTSDTAGDEGAVTLRESINASGACADSQWTRVEFDFAATQTNFQRGAQFHIKITAGAGVMNSGSDYVLFADAQVDKGVLTATTLKQNPPPVEVFPAGLALPYGGAYNAVPPGFLFCDGSAVSRAKYHRLFSRLGTSYGSGDGSTTFNLPDLRGRVPVGMEIPGSSQSRMELSMSATGTSAEYTLTVTSTAGLRKGMGAYGNANVASGAYITDLTPTVVTLSAAHTDNVSGTVRFSKLGGGDPETLGAAGVGMTGSRFRRTIKLGPCSTASSTTLTVPSVAGLAVGMEITGHADVTTGGNRTIAAFISDTTLLLNSAASGTTSSLQLEFSMPDAPDSAEDRYEYARLRPVVRCSLSPNPDQNPTLGTGNANVRVGMKVIGPASALTTAGATPVYVTAVSGTALTVNAPGVDGVTVDLEFDGSGSTTSATPTPDTLPAQTVNWIIKT